MTTTRTQVIPITAGHAARQRRRERERIRRAQAIAWAYRVQALPVRRAGEREDGPRGPKGAA